MFRNREDSPLGRSVKLRERAVGAAIHHSPILPATTPVKPCPCRLTATQLSFPIYVQAGGVLLHLFRYDPVVTSTVVGDYVPLDLNGD